MGSCAAPSAKGDDKFITTDYLQQCQKKEPASKNIGDEQLSLLRLLAGKFPHEIRMLRALFNENDNHCQLIAHIFFIHD
ncbi:hypothetical protein KHC81_005174 [Escherichia coli]|nr:hypothetical protein [Escherichia coli]